MLVDAVTGTRGTPPNGRSDSCRAGDVGPIDVRLNAQQDGASLGLCAKRT